MNRADYVHKDSMTLEEKPQVFTRWIDPTIKELKQENQKLKKQLEYLRSGEYYNQLRFERDMLQNVVDNGEVSKEDKEFIDMTHRNTELLEENQELKNSINALQKELNEENLQCSKYAVENHELKNQLENCYCERTDCAGRIKDSRTYDSLVQRVENQQKEFIKYLTSYIDLLSNNPDLIEEAEIDILEEILSKYKSIIGGKE